VTDVDQSGRGRAKRLPRHVREKQILDAAVAVFSEHGYYAASMDGVSDTAGVSKPMIYAYLGSKEELFAQCIRREADRIVTAVQSEVRTDVPPDMQLWHGLRAFYEFVGAHRESWNVMHRQALAVGGAFADEISRVRSTGVGMVSRLVITAGSHRGLGDQVRESGEAMSVALVGAAESLADWWLDHPDVSPGNLASYLMNLTWLGFNDLIAGEVWRPSGGTAST